ncbi:MAG: hypothetical protein HDS59_03080 [Barnesiella sp.]|nr:hypothetical protein [Barnesiella sp.]
MKHRLKVITATLLLFASLLCPMRLMSENIKSPDFAFPVKVRTQAETHYKTAIKQKNYPDALRALVDKALAETAIAPDSAGIQATEIEHFAVNCKDKAVSSLAFLFCAKIYNDIYSANRWNYDKRTLPLIPLDTNVKAWSGEQFRYKINNLCDSAVVNICSLPSIPLERFKNLITIPAGSQLFYPTLYDFVASKVIDLKSAQITSDSRLPLSTLSFGKSPAILKTTRHEMYDILNLYDSLINKSNKDSAPYIYWTLEKLRFIKNRLYNSENDNSETKYKDMLLQLYKEYSSSQFCTLPLHELTNLYIDPDNIKEIKELFGAVKSAIANYPDAPLVNCLKNYINQIERKSVEIIHNSYLVPGGTIQVKINAKNTSEAYLNLYRLPDDFTDLSNYVRNSAKSVKIQSKAVRFSGIIPFNSRDSVTFTIDRPGRYIIIPSFSGASNTTDSYPVIRVSALTAGVFAGDENSIVVVEPVTGAPVEGAEIIGFKQQKGTTTTERLGITNADGLSTISNRFNGSVRPVKNTDRFAGSAYIYDHSESGNNTYSYISIFCDLPIYHPGDSVNWACIAYSSIGKKMSTLNDKTLKVILFDANHSPVDTINVTTDALGRASGKFSIPKGLLTGKFTISASTTDERTKARGSIGVLVSDYKLPTYILDNLNVQNDTPEKGCTTLTGVAKTFSGVPLSGIAVKLNIALLPTWWRAAASSEIFFSDETVTDANGKFKFVINKDDYGLSPNKSGAFVATFTANSSTGESATAKRTYTLGTKYHLIADFPSDIDISKPIRLNVYARDAEGLPVKETISFKVVSEGKDTVLSGEIMNGNLVDLSKLDSGIYSIIFNATDAEQIDVTNVALYRPEDLMPPRKTTLWIPIKSVTDGQYLLIGTTNSVTNLLYTITSGNKIVSRKWLKYSPGLHNLEIKLPEGCEDARLWLFSIADYKSTTQLITIEPRIPTKKISISTETWRDKLIPGSEEMLTFKVCSSDSTPVKAGVMLDMFNAALNTFGKHSLNFSPRSGYVPTADFNAPNAFSYSYTNIFSPYTSLKCTDILSPELNTYTRGFNSAMIKGAVRMLYGARSMGVNISDEADNGAVLYEAAATDMTFAMAKKEASTEEIGITTEAGGADENIGDETFEYRNSEVPLAFFAPMLTTDENGILSYSYTVPNANASWLLCATAYTADLKTAYQSLSAIASKPLMVSPNLPRFIRTGDEIFIESQIFNTTTEDISVNTTVEILNPANGDTLQTDTIENNVSANSSTVIRTGVKAPFDIPFICFRIKSSDGKFSDGEQALIPVLPSSTQVIESTDFYIPANSKDFKLTLPDYSPDSKVILTYCDNPVWNVVTALPGMSRRNNDSASEAARNIFSAAVAEGLVKRYPQISEAIRTWSKNPQDSTLTSMLERNADMKSLLLSATPWMQNAQSDSERMMNLALLLDEKECSKVINDAVDCLEKLQNENGGLSWISQYKTPSLWSTSNVLITLGKLNTLGFMPENSHLKNICDKALDYTQKEYSAIYMKNTKSNFITFATIASLWSDFKPSTIGRSMISSEKQRIIKSWKSMGIAEKAEAATLLYRTGNKATAETILSSLDQYATVSNERGMWWQPLADGASGLVTVSATAKALEAYSLITPNAPQIERITQWLVLQKQTMDWGPSPAATEIVSSILTACPEWIVDDNSVKITLNGKLLNNKPKDYNGEIKIPLVPGTASGANINILRSSDTPAWGGIVSYDTKEMKHVKADACSNLSISKQFIKVGDKNPTSTDSLKVGDKVKITLTIKSEAAIDYLAITDNRAACFEPVEQTPAPIWSDGICFYRENRDSSTNIFVEHLPKGTFVIEYEMWVNNSGEFASGIATAQSQYAPEITAHSAGKMILSSPVIR